MIDLRNMKFLVVDDMENMRFIVKNTLNTMGIKDVVVASDGKVAIKVLELQQIDFIISDWNMPVVTGLELLKWVRNNDKTKDIPFLMVTAEAEKDHVLSAIQSGVSDYITKPFVPVMLMDKIKAIVNK